MKLYLHLTSESVIESLFSFTPDIPKRGKKHTWLKKWRVNAWGNVSFGHKVVFLSG